MFSLGPPHLGVRWYGVFNAAGFLLALVMVVAEARRQRLDMMVFVRMLALVSVAGLAGGRLTYVLLDAPAFARACSQGTVAETPRSLIRALGDCTLPLQVWRGGMVLYGALLSGTLAGITFARAQRWPYWALADLFAPPVAAGIAVGRLGCLAAGCCFGKETDVPWALAFAAGTPAARQYGTIGGEGRTPPLHPTQFYEALCLTALLTVMLWMRWRRRRRDAAAARSPGAIALVFLAGYAAVRFAIELFRGDVVRGFVTTWRTPALSSLLHLPPARPTLLSTSQLASVLVALLAAGLTLARLPRPPASTPTAAGKTALPGTAPQFETVEQSGLGD